MHTVVGLPTNCNSLTLTDRPAHSLTTSTRPLGCSKWDTTCENRSYVRTACFFSTGVLRKWFIGSPVEGSCEIMVRESAWCDRRSIR